MGVYCVYSIMLGPIAALVIISPSFARFFDSSLDPMLKVTENYCDVYDCVFWKRLKTVGPVCVVLLLLPASLFRPVQTAVK